jgi:polyhydroxybutyrate depolymerase
MRLRRMIGLLVAAALAGCGTAPETATTGTVTVSTADGERTALVHRPASAGPGSPLVVVLHGARDSAAKIQADSGWDRLADREGFVVAYPEGLDATWNAGTCCGRAQERGVDDVGFLDALVGVLRDSHGIEAARVGAVGFSNGAMMTYAWACARPGRLTGIGPVAGARLVDCPAPGPLDVVALHGTADEVVPMRAGPSAAGTEAGPNASLAPFLAGCAADPAVVTEGAATVATWACDGGRTVVRDVITGLGHVWPGAGPDAGTSDGPEDATGFLWSRLSGRANAAG